jgi:hypothetical protein
MLKEDCSAQMAMRMWPPRMQNCNVRSYKDAQCFQGTSSVHREAT